VDAFEAERLEQVGSLLDVRGAAVAGGNDVHSGVCTPAASEGLKEVSGFRRAFAQG
jgi:hypothetical protein